MIGSSASGIDYYLPVEMDIPLSRLPVSRFVLSHLPNATPAKKNSKIATAKLNTIAVTSPGISAGRDSLNKSSQGGGYTQSLDPATDQQEGSQ